MVKFYIKTNLQGLKFEFSEYLLSFGLISLISELGQTPTNIGRTGGRTEDQKLFSADD